MSARKVPKNSATISSTSSTGTAAASPQVEHVEDVDARPSYVWDMNDGLPKNFDRLGELLSKLPRLQLFQNTDGDGLIYVDGARV